MGMTLWGVLSLCLLALVASIRHMVRPKRVTLGVAVGGAAGAFIAGLLGSVLGLRLAYAQAAHADPTMKASVLAAAISQA